MKEEIITSGRMNLNIDPVLHIWHWQIPVYLFLGGLAAGLLFFAALQVIRGKEEKFHTTVAVAPIIAPIAIGLGLIALMLDLKHPLYAWQLYTTIRLESPMSWGAWTLMAVMPLSIAWVAIYLDKVFPTIQQGPKPIMKFLMLFVNMYRNDEKEIIWEYRYKWLRNFKDWTFKNRVGLAWIILPFAVILGVYTGILLSAFNARPLWNNSLLGPLFLVSGLSTGAAAIMWLSDNKEEKLFFSRIDVGLIIIELFFIVHLFMGFLAGPEVQIDAAQLFLGGYFTAPFWGLVVVMGLIVPLIMEVLELRGFHIPIAIPAALILIGGAIFRFIMVEAGQITRWLY